MYGEAWKGLVVEGDVAGVVTVEGMEVLEKVGGEMERGKEVEESFVGEARKRSLKIPKNSSRFLVGLRFD